MTELFITGFINIRWLDILDILLVALLLYELYKLLKGTVAINILIGILALFLIWKVVSALKMELLDQILGGFISVGFIALIVIFQPEIRQFLFTLGTPKFMSGIKKKFFFWQTHLKSYKNELDIDKIIVACQRMSEAQQGALIVIAKTNELQTFTDTGEILNAEISSSLIENIFYKNSLLHDGALIIVRNKIRAAGCILPVSSNKEIPARLGLRHRAAAGITEQSDAIAIVVSEQTGRISYCKNGELSRRVQPAQLKDFLVEEFGLE